MRSLSRRYFLTLTAGGALALLAASPVLAQDLNALLASGKLGERYDGFVQARDPAVQSTANQINGKRRELYQKRASETGQTVEVVGKVYAAEIYKKAPAGTWFLLENGSWVQK